MDFAADMAEGDGADAAEGCASQASAPLAKTEGEKPPPKAVARRERGSLFSRLRLGGGDEEAREEASAAGAASVPGSGHGQQLEAMSEQLEAVTSCMKDEQRARIAAEAELEASREQVRGLLKHLADLEKVRKGEAETLAALRGLLGQLQTENSGLKDQNAELVAQCRTLMGSGGSREGQ